MSSYQAALIHRQLHVELIERERDHLLTAVTKSILSALCTPHQLRTSWDALKKRLPGYVPPKLAPAIPRPRFSAPFATLMRRAYYGGRKGRRAMKRLMAMPDHVWKLNLK